MKNEEIRKAVRERYSNIARQTSSCCGPVNDCGCGGSMATVSKAIGYTEEQLSAVPDGANLGLGCGNPTALASLKEGEVVLDLGSGGGLDCFLAANIVGENGRVIGIDMTSEMVEKARENARNGDFKNVEFRLGEIEHLPVADNSVDVIISNCVINLSPDKGQVYREVYRVLKPGGRIMVSDIVLLKELPDVIRSSIEAYVGCVAGASMKEEYLAAVAGAGFQGVSIVSEVSVKGMYDGAAVKSFADSLGISPEAIEAATDSIASIQLMASKPS